MSKKYAVIEGYGKMIVPISLLEKVTSQCLMGSTRWSEEGGEVLTEVSDIGKVLIIDQDDIDSAKAQMALSGE